MNQLRLDPLSGRWTVVSTERAARPGVLLPRKPPPFEEIGACPFCPGNEDATPPALETYGDEGRWLVRVVPNKFPAFSGATPFVVDHRGPVFTEAPASGIHEVLIFSPHHDLSWSEFSDRQSDLVMSAIRDRIEEHQSTPGLRYSQAIVNSGREAGASLEHPHGQLFGIPFVPRELVDEQGSFNRFAGGCLLCTAASAEERAEHRIVQITERAVTFTPFWSGTPYELLIVPRAHQAHLHHATPDDLSAVGTAIRGGLFALFRLAGEVAYNVVFHSSPYRASSPFHWHVHILPKLTTRAAFELGTGVYINVVAPERAAEELRGALAGLGHSSEDVAS